MLKVIKENVTIDASRIIRSERPLACQNYLIRRSLKLPKNMSFLSFLPILTAYSQNSGIAASQVVL